MKKILAAVTTVMLIISLSACSGGTGKSAGSSRAASSTVSSSAAKSEAASVDTSVMVALQVNVDYVNKHNLNNVAYICDILLVINKLDMPIKVNTDNVPMNLWKNIINTTENVISGVIIE